jgi:hypothetical protein
MVVADPVFNDSVLVVVDAAEVAPMELLGLHVGQTVVVFPCVVAVVGITVFNDSGLVVIDAAEVVPTGLLYIHDEHMVVMLPCAVVVAANGCELVRIDTIELLSLVLHFVLVVASNGFEYAVLDATEVLPLELLYSHVEQTVVEGTVVDADVGLVVGTVCEPDLQLLELELDATILVFVVSLA